MNYAVGCHRTAHLAYRGGAEMNQNDVNTEGSSESLVSLKIQSSQRRLYALMYRAGYKKSAPVIIIAHGIPGHEKNIALAQQLRQSGFNVLIYSYSGSWGSEGHFSFANCVEDEIAIVDFVLNDNKYNLDKSNIFLIGHSFGCYVAAKAMMERKEIRGAVFMMPYDIGRHYQAGVTDASVRSSLRTLLKEVAMFIPGTNSDDLYEEVKADPDYYSYYPFACELAQKPIFWVSCYNEPHAPEYIHTIPFMELIKDSRKTNVIWKRYLTDHYYGGILPLITKEIVQFLRDSIKQNSVRSTLDFTDKLNQLIEREYQSLNTNTAAASFQLSEAYFSDLVRKKTGRTFTELLRKYRMEMAKKLLEETSIKIEEIAFLVGYNNEYYFMKHFKKEEGMTPTEFRKSNTEK